MDRWPPRSQRRRRARGWLAFTSLKGWPMHRWLFAALVGTAAALVMGVPTGIIETRFYTRMTPVTWWDYPVWATSAVLLGLTAATYVRLPRPAGEQPYDGAGRTLGASMLSTFAVGCPVCNKLLVALLGAGGAITYWAPMQPVLGLLSIALLSAGLIVRLRQTVVCAVPAVR